MPIQFLPLLQAIAPYVAQVAAAAIPAFTRKPKPTEDTKSDPVVAKQIEELQEAATKNAESIHLLAENIQQAMQGIETAAADAKKQIAAYKTMLFISLGFSGISTLLCIFLLIR